MIVSWIPNCKFVPGLGEADRNFNWIQIKSFSTNIVKKMHKWKGKFKNVLGWCYEEILYCTGQEPNVRVRGGWTSWLPYSTDFIFVFVSSMTNMKEHSREICYMKASFIHWEWLECWYWLTLALSVYVFHIRPSHNSVKETKRLWESWKYSEQGQNCDQGLYCLRGCIIIFVTLVWLFSTVHFQIDGQNHKNTDVRQAPFLKCPSRWATCLHWRRYIHTGCICEPPYHHQDKFFQNQYQRSTWIWSVFFISFLT